MRQKFIVSLLSIAVMLLISCIISVMEYTRMSNYVSGLIADNVNSINVASKLSEASNSYNLDILAVIGDETSLELPEFDENFFRENCAVFRNSAEVTESVRSLADSVMYSYSAYMLTAMELEDVLQSNFIDTRSWYFERLQPKFARLSSDIDNLSSAIYSELEKNSATFERGFYRSVIPGIVAVGVGLLLIFMLLFFVLTGYVNPIYHMLDSLKAYRTNDKKYNYRFEGDDQLTELNEGIAELTNENQQLRKRISFLKK
ncbi:MAG: hypothetical protein MJY89_02170 [Bacteroidales bacterium]|nr:hypothetical protein [Bacteroidales bacterium]